jgi:hypothetical protein
MVCFFHRYRYRYRTVRYRIGKGQCSLSDSVTQQMIELEKCIVCSFLLVAVEICQKMLVIFLCYFFKQQMLAFDGFSVSNTGTVYSVPVPSNIFTYRYR